MFGKFIILGIVVLIVILVIFLAHDCVEFKKAKDVPKDVSDKVLNAKNKHVVRITDAPTVCIRTPGAKSYEQTQLTKKEAKIGRGSKNEVVVDDDTVENVHAVIQKKIKGTHMFYELINLSKSNPVEYFNQDTNCYEYVGYKRGVILSGDEIFYIGETKMVVKCPKKGHVPTKTERVAVSENSRLRTYYGESQNEDDFNDEVTREVRVGDYKREPSLRVVSKNEIDI